jgi:hypothetical protein
MFWLVSFRWCQRYGGFIFWTYGCLMPSFFGVVFVVSNNFVTSETNGGAVLHELSNNFVTTFGGFRAKKKRTVCGSPCNWLFWCFINALLPNMLIFLLPSKIKPCHKRMFPCFRLLLIRLSPLISSME